MEYIHPKEKKDIYVLNLRVQRSIFGKLILWNYLEVYSQKIKLPLLLDKNDPLMPMSFWLHTNAKF